MTRNDALTVELKKAIKLISDELHMPSDDVVEMPVRSLYDVYYDIKYEDGD